MKKLSTFFLLVCVFAVNGATISPVLNSNAVYRMFTNLASTISSPTNGLTAAQTTNAIAVVATFTNTLYVAPWANDSIATRGDISKPFSISNAFAQVRNYERIAVMGSNFVNVRVPLPIGQSYVETNIVAAPLVLSNKTGVTIEGLAGGGIFWTNYGTVATFVKTTNISVETLEWNGTIKKPIISGGYTNGLASAIIILNSGQNISFRNCILRNFASQGIYALNVMNSGRSNLRGVKLFGNTFENIGDDTFLSNGDGTAVVPVGDDWQIIGNSFQNSLRAIELYIPPNAHGTQSGHIYSDNVFSNISHVAIFQLNEGHALSNTIRGLKISDNVIQMSRSLPGTLSSQLGGIELRGPLLDSSISGNIIEGTNTLMTFGIDVISANGPISGVSISDNTVRGFYFRGIQLTDGSTTNRVTKSSINGAVLDYGQMGWLVSGEDITVSGVKTYNLGSYVGYIETNSVDVVVRDNINKNGTYYVHPSAVRTIFINNWWTDGFGFLNNGEPIIEGTGINTLTNSVYKYTYAYFPGVTDVVDLRGASSYLTNSWLYNVQYMNIPRNVGAFNRFITFTNTAAGGKRWDIIVGSDNAFGFYNDTDNVVGLNISTNGTITVPGSVVTAFTNQSFYLNVASVGEIGDLRAAASYLTNTAILNATQFKMSRDASSDTRFMRISNAVANGASWVANLSVDNSFGWREEKFDIFGWITYTNGHSSLTGNQTNLGTVLLRSNATNSSPSIMLTRNPTTGAIEDSAVPVGGSVTTNFNVASFNNITVSNAANISNITASTVRTTNFVLANASTQGYVLAVQGDGVTIAPTNAPTGGSGTKSIESWFATDNKPPAQTYATFGVLGTTNPVDVLQFDDTTEQGAVFRGRVQEGLSISSGVYINIDYCSTNTSGTIGWKTALRVLTGRLPTQVWGTTNTITAATVPGVAQTFTNSTTTYTLGNLPAGFTNGAVFELLILRDVANDTATGKASFLGAEVRAQ